MLKHWNDLLVDGEYPERSRVVNGLRFKEVSTRLPGTTHSLYEELWHATRWQEIVLSGDSERRRAWLEGSLFPPTAGPRDEAEFQTLVKQFMDGLRQAVALTEKEDLAREVRPGVTRADQIAGLAVHNAYHLGKMVALRQVMDRWDTESVA